MNKAVKVLIIILSVILILCAAGAAGVLLRRNSDMIKIMDWSGKKKEILLENTYKLGYESMKMKTITLKPVKFDRETMESGNYDALFAG